jgi:hypothetical protein
MIYQEGSGRFTRSLEVVHGGQRRNKTHFFILKNKQHYFFNNSRTKLILEPDSSLMNPDPQYLLEVQIRCGENLSNNSKKSMGILQRQKTYISCVAFFPGGNRSSFISGQHTAEIEKMSTNQIQPICRCRLQTNTE